MGQVLDMERRDFVAKAYVVVDQRDPSLSALNRLAGFLVSGGAPGSGVVVVDRGRARRTGQRASGTGRTSPRRAGMSGLSISGWTLLATGLATAMGGGIALGLDGKDAVKADATHEREVFTTAKLGYGLLGGGLSLAVVGAALLLGNLAIPSRKPAGRQAPQVSFTADGRQVMLGIRGRF